MNLVIPNARRVVPVLAAALAAGCAGGSAITPTPYAGWAGSYRLANDRAEMVVVPRIARVMSFAVKGGANLLWQDAALRGKASDLTAKGWQNFGGAKLWIAPQSAWKWPPPPVIDRAPCAASVHRGRLRLVGAASLQHGLRLDREYRLLPGRPVVECTYTLVNTGDQPAAWGIWSVAQLLPGGRAMVPAPHGSRVWGSKDTLKQPQWRRTNDLLVCRVSGKASKVFAVSPVGWMAYACRGHVFVMTFAADTKAAYPPGHASHEFFTCDRYVEMEHVGPLVTLKPGERGTLRERWHVYRLPRPDLTDAELRAFVESQTRGGTSPDRP